MTRRRENEIRKRTKAQKGVLLNGLQVWAVQFCWRPAGRLFNIYLRIIPWRDVKAG
jgi:hypothetical protein